MQIKSEMEDLIIFFITSPGFLKFTKCFPSMYVSIETTILLVLLKSPILVFVYYKLHRKYNNSKIQV